jgi:Zn-dependent protease
MKQAGSAIGRFVRAACRGTVGMANVLIFAGAPLMLLERSPPRQALLAACIGFCIAGFAFVLAIFAHELGHAAAGRLAGSTLVRMSIGPLWWTNRVRGGRLSLHFLRNTPAGFVLVLPNPDISIRRQKIVLLAGGPAANLSLAAVTVWFVSPLLQRSVWMGAAVLGFFLFNLTLGLGNLLPIGKAVPSDGSQIWRWWRHPEHCSEDLKVLRLCGQSIQGRTASELPCTDLQDLAQSSEPAKRFFAGYLLLRRAQQLRDRPEFERLYADHREQMAALDAPARKNLSGLWTYFHCEDAYERALDGSVAKARHLLGQKAWKTMAGHIRWRVEAVVAMDAGQLDEAVRLFARIEKEIAGHIEGATRIAEAALLADMRQRWREEHAACVQGSSSNPS